MSESTPVTAIEALRQTVRRLRDPEYGCPWDRAQTLRSLAPYTLEEAYEVVDAIDRADAPALCGELGDLLLQVVLQSQLAEEAGAFDFEAVCRGIRDKMVRRHPHVFANGARAPDGAAVPDWETLKAQEPGRGGDDSSVLAGIEAGMPAWQRASRLQKRAAKVGFDWQGPAEAMAKLEEEVAEVRAELDAGAPLARLEDELGDVLFAAVSLARHAGIDLGRAMRGANRKFERRFRQMEADRPAGLAGCSRQELMDLWRRAKQQPAPDPEPAVPGSLWGEAGLP